MQNNLTLAICAYNCEKYIEETLTCILNQTFKDFDLLVVNDCSTDNTKKLIQQFFRKNNRQFNLVHFNENKGIAFGRKYVIENVNSKYIIFVDADDRALPNLVEKLHNKIESNRNLMAVGCYLEYIDKNDVKIGGGIFLGEKTLEGFYKKAENNKLIFMASPAIFNRELALEVGGIKIDGYFEGKPRYQDLCEDLDLWTRMSDLCLNRKAIIVIPEVLCQYRKMEQTTSTNTFGMILKIKYIKSNLLKRRNGQNEETFVNFFNSINDKQMELIQREANSAIMLRDGAFALREWKILFAFEKIMQSIWLNPTYMIHKIKHNIIRK